MPPVISLVGKSNSGKTTLLENLIPQLTERGFRVGILKHHNHVFEFDIPGKDTWRHKKAGAQVVALSTPSGVGIVTDTEHDLPIDELVMKYYQDVDIVITEGYKRGPYPKIEVHRKDNKKPLIDERDESWIAFISDSPVDTKLPVFGINNHHDVADFLVASILNNDS